jgi:hypothetical protein
MERATRALEKGKTQFTATHRMWDVGLRQILTRCGTWINFINTAGVRRMKCGAKIVTPADLIRGN